MRACAVVGRPDEQWGERVVAVVQAVQPDDAPTLDELRDIRRRRAGAGRAAARSWSCSGCCRCSTPASPTGLPCAPWWPSARSSADGDRREWLEGRAAPDTAGGRRAGRRRHRRGRGGRRAVPRPRTARAARRGRAAGRRQLRERLQRRHPRHRRRADRSAAAGGLRAGRARRGADRGARRLRRRCGHRPGARRDDDVVAAARRSGRDRRRLVLHGRLAALRLPGPRRGLGVRLLRPRRDGRHDVRAGGADHDDVGAARRRLRCVRVRDPGRQQPARPRRRPARRQADACRPARRSADPMAVRRADDRCRTSCWCPSSSGTRPRRWPSSPLRWAFVPVRKVLRGARGPELVAVLKATGLVLLAYGVVLLVALAWLSG